MKLVPLTQGQFAKVDDEDFERLLSYKWQAKKYRKTFYAARSIRTQTGKQKTLSMHRFIMGCPVELEVDHIDGDGLNNQKQNLRIVTTRQNHQNLHRKSTSFYPGVCWDKKEQKWHAAIRIKNKIKKLGRFKDELDAAKAYFNALESIGERPIENFI